MAPADHTPDLNDPSLTPDELRAIAQNYRRLLEEKGAFTWLREKQYTDSLFAHAPFLLYEYDEQMRLVRWNKLFEEITGYTATELYGRNVFEWFTEHEQPVIVEGLKRMWEEGFASVEGPLRTKDGRQIPYLFMGVRLSIGEKVSFTGIGIDVTERKRAEQALWDSEERLREFITHSRDGIVMIDSRGSVIEWNEAEEQITGISRSEAIGQDVWDLQYRLAPSESRTPEFREKAREIVIHILTGPDTAPRLVEESIEREDGTRRIIESAIFTSDGEAGRWAGGITRDITSRKSTEDAVRRNEERLRTFVDQAPMAIGVGKKGLLQYANARYIQLFGAACASDIVGHQALEHFAEQCREEVAQYIANRDKGLPAPDEYETVGLRLDGTEFPAYVRINRVELADGPVTLAFVTDISDRKRAESALAHANEQLKVEREILQRKNVALQELVLQVDEGRKSTAAQIQLNIEKIVLPILDRLALKLDSQGKEFLKLAQSSLADILAPFASSLASKAHNLTMREIELCEFIRRGLDSKEIAQIRGCSVQTVIKQRKLVRKKLGISGQDVNLAAFINKVVPVRRTGSKSND